MVSKQVWEETWQVLLPLYQEVANQAQQVCPQVTWAFYHSIELNRTTAFFSYASASGPHWPSWEDYDDGFAIRADCMREKWDDVEGTLHAFAVRDQFPDEDIVGPARVIPLVPEKEELARREIKIWLEDMATWLDENTHRIVDLVSK